MKPYQAAYLVTFLLTSEEPITTESIEGVLLASSTMTRWTTVKGHADRVRRKAPEAMKRSDEQDRAWLDQSMSLIVLLLRFTADSNVDRFNAALFMLRANGWADTLDRIARRLSASLHGNFPPKQGSLSRAAARLLATKQGRPPGAQ
jgi:hypothetical protein